GGRRQLPRLYRDALLASLRQGDSAASEGMAGRRGDPAAALSAVLDNDDGLVLSRLEPRGEGGGPQCPDPRDLLLSGGTWLYRGGSRADRPDPAANGGEAGPAALLRPWPAAEDCRCGRSLSEAGGTKRRRCRRKAWRSGARLASVLSKSRRAAEMAGTRDGCGNYPRRQRRGVRDHCPHRVRLGTFGNSRRA